MKPRPKFPQLTNHNARKYHSEPIRAAVKTLKSAESAGKFEKPFQGWVTFYGWLAVKTILCSDWLNRLNQAANRFFFYQKQIFANKINTNQTKIAFESQFLNQGKSFSLPCTSKEEVFSYLFSLYTGFDAAYLHGSFCGQKSIWSGNTLHCQQDSLLDCFSIYNKTLPYQGKCFLLNLS